MNDLPYFKPTHKQNDGVEIMSHPSGNPNWFIDEYGQVVTCFDPVELDGTENRDKGQLSLI